MKSITVIIAGSGNHHDLQIEPATTASDILAEIGLSSYVLSKDANRHTFAASENVYQNVDDGEKLVAAAKSDVGISTPSRSQR